MKSNLYTFLLITMFSGIFFSCKKSSNSIDKSNSITVKYVITATDPFVPYSTLAANGLSQDIVYQDSVIRPAIAYPNNISGTVWTKQFQIKNPVKGSQLGFDADLILQGLGGNATGTIYVNGISKAVIAPFSTKGTGTETVVVINGVGAYSLQ